MPYAHLKSWGLVLLASLALSCADTREAPSDATGREAALLPPLRYDDTPLYAHPAPDADILLRLPQGSRLYDRGEVGKQMSAMQLQGITYYEPWLAAATADGQEGWVYAGAIGFEVDAEGKPDSLLLRRRVYATFGSQLGADIYQWQEAYEDLDTDATSSARLYEQGMQLSQQLIQHLARTVRPAPGGRLPDLFWLKHVFPGFVPQLAQEGSAYHLFADYRQWAARAARTSTPADDEMVGLFLEVFPEDSVAYFFPAWVLQTEAEKGHSLLGRGIHSRLLQRIDALQRAGSPYTSTLQSLKTALLDDMTSEGREYWESPELIAQELDTILAMPLAILSDADRIALKVRRSAYGE